MHDVAKRAGVSIATVSAVLNRSAYVSPELKQRVRQAIGELDYTVNHVARSLQTRSSRTVGMLIPEFANPDPFFGQVVRGAEDVLRSKGYCLMLGQTYNQAGEQERYLAAFRSRMADGLMLFLSPGDDSVLRKMVENRRAIVFLGRVPSFKADVVATDIAGGTEMAVAHLIRKGHRQIGLVTVSGSLTVAAGRVEGWRKALHMAGLPAEDASHYTGELSPQTGRQAVEYFLNLPKRPSAIFSDDLVLMTGIVRGLMERGVDCPGTVEVMSSDDADWLDVFHPRLSTVVQPSYEIGKRAAELLLKRIRHPRRAFERILLHPTLRIRD